MWLLTTAWAGPALEPGEASLDRPTVTALGVRWAIAGDDDHDAVVTVRYREAGGAWRPGLPLRRVYPEDVVGWTAADELAGSVWDLLPATTYDVELTATDPDGGGAVVTLSGTTRAVPGDPASPAQVDVSTANALQNALDAASPGDVIAIADGTYVGPFTIEADGTATNPIVIRGASEEGAVLTGGGCPDCNVLEVYGSWVHLEDVTLTDANRALRFQGVGAEGNVVRRVHARGVGLGFGSKEDQLDFYLCDNTLEGPLAWPHVYTDDNGADADVDGILVMGHGHVVCHNHLVGWGDAMKVAQDGARAIDFYGNDVEEAYDNGLELDTSEGNVRALRNRFTNTYATLSFQPVRGGPAYVVRNLVVNVAHEQLKFHSLGGNEETSGIVVVHNTFVSADAALTLADDTVSHHFLVQGNLFVAPDGVNRVVDWSSGGIDDGVFDGDGFYPDGRFDFGPDGDWPTFAAMVGAGTFEANGVLLDGPPLASGLATPTDWHDRVAPQDPTPRGDSAAVDAALLLPGVNDDYAENAPDLGAQELGCPVPTYGPRPVGVDESAGAPSCGSPPTTPTTPSSTLPTGPTGPSGTDPAPDAPGTKDDPGGCGCTTPGSPSAAVLLLAIALGVRRSQSRRVPSGP